MRLFESFETPERCVACTDMAAATATFTRVGDDPGVRRSRPACLVHLTGLTTDLVAAFATGQVDDLQLKAHIDLAAVGSAVARMQVPA